MTDTPSETLHVNMSTLDLGCVARECMCDNTMHCNGDFLIPLPLSMLFEGKALIAWISFIESSQDVNS